MNNQTKKRGKAKTFSQSGVINNPMAVRTPGPKVAKVRVNSNANLRAYIGGSYNQTRFSLSKKGGSSTMKKQKHSKSTLNSAFQSRGGFNNNNTPQEFEQDHHIKAQTSINEQSLAAQSIFKGNITSKTISKPELELNSQMMTFEQTKSTNQLFKDESYKNLKKNTSTSSLK